MTVLAPKIISCSPWNPATRFNPAAILAWFDDSTGDRGGTGTWPERRGGGPNLTFTALATSGTRKGRFTVAVDGYYGNSSFTCNQPFAVVIACKFGAWEGTNQALTDGATGAVRIRRVTETILQITAGTNLNSDAIATLEDWNIIGANFNGASSSIWLNGAMIKSGDAGANNAGGLVLGALSGGGTPFSGEVAEVHVLDSTALTPTQMALDSWFVRRKWV